MNLEQFAALKVGDKIDNPMSQSQGTVTELVQDGVRVRWGNGAPGKTVEFTYVVNSTAWFHWVLPGANLFTDEPLGEKMK